MAIIMLVMVNDADECSSAIKLHAFDYADDAHKRLLTTLPPRFSSSQCICYTKRVPYIFTEKHIEAANKSKDLAFIGVLWPLNVFAAELIRR